MRNKMYRLVSLLLPFSIVKAPFQFKLYMQAAFPLYGLFNLIFERLFSKEFLFLFAIPLWAFLLGLYHKSPGQLARSLQLFLIYSAFHLILVRDRKNEMIKWVKILTSISILHCLIQVIFTHPFTKTAPIFGISFYRYFGIVGDPNFSAFAYFGTFLILDYFDEKKVGYLNLIPLFLTGSRTAILSVLLYLFLKVVLLKRKKIVKYFLQLFLLFYFLYPFLLKFSYLLPDKIYNFLNKTSSARLEIHRAYSNIFYDNFWGVGYFNGVNIFKNYQQRFNIIETHEQHNSILQVASELGLVGYFVFLFFFLKLYRISVKREDYRVMILMMAFLFYTLFLNTTHALLLYFLFSVVVNGNKVEQKVNAA